MITRLDLRGLEDPTEGLPRPERNDADVLESVRSTLEAVRTGGDAALLELTERFDGVRLDRARVPTSELREALDAQPSEVRAALELAAERVRLHHRAQLRPEVVHDDGGVAIRSYWVPVDRVGCYVPGGRAAYPSTLLMTVVPARVAGVREIVVVAPPTRFGSENDHVLATCHELGVSHGSHDT